jgi:hypothetical protein
MDPILISNSFPFSLIRREVLVTPRAMEDLRNVLMQTPFRSAWGHTNTVHAAGEILGHNLTPKSARPAIELSPDNLPSMDGTIFKECWLLTPNYVTGFRPQIGEEVSPEKITGWQVLLLTWLDSENSSSRSAGEHL